MLPLLSLPFPPSFCFLIFLFFLPLCFYFFSFSIYLFLLLIHLFILGLSYSFQVKSRGGQAYLLQRGGPAPVAVRPGLWGMDWFHCWIFLQLAKHEHRHLRVLLHRCPGYGDRSVPSLSRSAPPGSSSPLLPSPQCQTCNVLHPCLLQRGMGLKNPRGWKNFKTRL